MLNGEGQPLDQIFELSAIASTNHAMNMPEKTSNLVSSRHRLNGKPPPEIDFIRSDLTTGLEYKDLLIAFFMLAPPMARLLRLPLTRC